MDFYNEKIIVQTKKARNHYSAKDHWKVLGLYKDLRHLQIIFCGVAFWCSNFPVMFFVLFKRKLLGFKKVKRYCSCISKFWTDGEVTSCPL